ncbi:MAG TPA: alkaline phosphatase PhoX [Gemmatimonadales bacterium]|nr:alkaline phosphatase PhoX [Gemmatimonadales bacterium]
MRILHSLRVATGVLFLGAGLACDEADRLNEPNSSPIISSLTTGQFKFTPLSTSTACVNGGAPSQPFTLPVGFGQTIIAREGDGGTADLWDMNTQNETGMQAGRFLYRTHEVGSNGQVSVTDLETNVTRVLATRPDWERLDGIVWTPWGTLLAAEETNAAALSDPAVPQAVAGLVYEINPETGAAVARPAIGSRSHEGLRFDPQGNLYGIAESSPPTGGYIYKFVPDQPGDLSSGQLHALQLVTPNADRTGEAVWVPLDRTAVQVSSDAAATAIQATGYPRPEDVEITTSTGNNRGGGNVLYVAITGEDRVLGIDLHEPDEGGQSTAFVYTYVRDGLNAPADFDSPDNLALDRSGNLYSAEDPGTASARGLGDDIWVASPSGAGGPQPAQPIVRFASLTDCNAEPSGIYFDQRGWALYVHAQHRGGDGRDLEVKIGRAE